MPVNSCAYSCKIRGRFNKGMWKYVLEIIYILISASKLMSKLTPFNFRYTSLFYEKFDNNRFYMGKNVCLVRYYTHCVL